MNFRFDGLRTQYQTVLKVSFCPARFEMPHHLRERGKYRGIRNIASWFIHTIAKRSEKDVGHRGEVRCSIASSGVSDDVLETLCVTIGKFNAELKLVFEVFELILDP
jgi:hypothetical protein